MKKVSLIFGIRPEAPGLGKPALVMCNTRERPEGLEAGTAKLIKAEAATIVPALSELLTNSQVYERTAPAMNPYRMVPLARVSPLSS